MRSRRLVPFSFVGLVVAGTLAGASCNAATLYITEDGGSKDAAPDHVHPGFDSAVPAPGPRTPVHAETTTTRADTEAMMFASGEMQISGEPFASTFAGRNLNDYDRTYLPTDEYLVPIEGEMDPIKDLFGFSTAVESYEYSKYSMRNIALQTTAGLPLAAGPVIQALPGADSLSKLTPFAEHLLQTVGADQAGYAQVPPPTLDTQEGNNYFGFRGLWPAFIPYKSFDPTIAPSGSIVASCTLSGGYGGIPTLGNLVPLYECTYNELHLVNRDAQVEKTIVPAVVGYSVWKEALWSIDFTSRLHDLLSNPVNTVAPQDMAQVGVFNNQVLATDPPGAAQGTYIGSTPLEGTWGIFMMSNMDNAAEWMVRSLMTSDGVTLGGFATLADATSYDFTSPIRWFPAATAATEEAVTLAAPYPSMTSGTITDASSRSVDLAALILGNAMFFGETDPRNPGIGQRNGLLCTFDGDPFPSDDGVADGEETPHDRALAILRVALVNLDRIHRDPVAHVLLDTATIAASGTVTRGNTATTISLAHSLIAMRQSLLSLNGAISQYGGADPGPSADAQGILNPIVITPPDATAPIVFSSRIRQVFIENAAFVRDVMTLPDGTVRNTATIANGKATTDTSPASLESQTSAIRALTEAYLVTQDETYRDRARAVVRRLDALFYSTPARLYRDVESGADSVHMNAHVFAFLQSSLRETYKVSSIPGDPVLDRSVLEDRVERVNKLFLNGWDDLNGDQNVDLTSECVGGRLQLGEQPLTGELGRDDEGHATSDRDSDCVLEIDDAKNASTLAGEVFFHSP